MSSTSRILVVAHDAGGARAVIPVAEELGRRGVLVEACVGGPAAPIWRSECPSIECSEVVDDLPLSQAEEIVRRASPSTLVSASGLYNRLEHTVRLAARAEGLRTVAVLDSWFNYAERFERRVGNAVVRSRPDTVCVIDDLSYRGMLDAGFGPEQLVLTGAPNLEASVRFCQSVTPVQRNEWRAECRISADELVIVFFSEPFVIRPNGEWFSGAGALVGRDGRSLFGYTPSEILETVMEELAGVCERANRPCTLVVKPHPSEHADGLEPILRKKRDRWVNAVIHRDGCAAQWIAIADALVGMMTIALLEAALAGKPALSVQIGLLESGAEDPCIGNLLGYTWPVYDRRELEDILCKICDGQGNLPEPASRRQLPIWGATERVATTVLAWS